MAEVDAVYVNASFIKSNRNATATETTYTEVETLNSEPSAELPGSQQQAAGGSKVTAERVAVVILLTAAVIAAGFTGYKYHQTTKHLQKLTDEYAAMRKNITADPCHRCQRGWQQNGPQCYYFSTDKLNWEQARERCRQNGADLVKIESEDEQSFLMHTLREKMVEDEDKFWIGLTDSETEGTWLWTDGTPLNKSLTFWSRGEPDNLKGKDVDEQDCVRMGEKSGSGLNWWFDQSCKATQRSICEKSAELDV